MGPFQMALIRLVTTGDAPSLTVTDCHFNDTDGIEAAVFAIDGAVYVSQLGLRLGGWLPRLRRVLAAVTPVVVLLPFTFPLFLYLCLASLDLQSAVGCGD